MNMNKLIHFLTTIKLLLGFVVAVPVLIISYPFSWLFGGKNEDYL